MTQITEELIRLGEPDPRRPVPASPHGRKSCAPAEAAVRAAYLRANAILQENCVKQFAEIERKLRFFAFARREMEAFQWRYYSLSLDAFGHPNATPKPPARFPAEMTDGFTMQGCAEIEYNYLDATYPDNWPLIYTDAEIDFFLKKIEKREYFIYGMTDVWLWEAIERYPIRNLDVVNMGSLTPWYESNCLYFGARSTTIDYNRIITTTSRIKTMTVAEWDVQRPVFDVAWSISSFEHDGLGMYGDPLDPMGDLKAMRKMKQVVKPGGLLFLSIPIGKDKVLFNNARIYGRIRLPMLMEGWKQIETIGLAPQHLDGPGHIQPIFILQNS